jgi:hypothetical protein
MAERKVTNNTILLMLSDDGVTFSTIVCLTSVSRSLKVDEVDASTLCGPDKSAGQLSGSVAFEGQSMLEADAGKITGTDLDTYMVDGTPFYWKIAPSVPADGDHIKTGNGFLSSLDDSYKLDTQAAFSGTITITGTPLDYTYLADAILEENNNQLLSETNVALEEE